MDGYAVHAFTAMWSDVHPDLRTRCRCTHGVQKNRTSIPNLGTLMKATFIELPPFERLRETYLDDASFKRLQEEMMKNPDAGDVIQGTGGLRKLRYADQRRSKGKRGGLRVIYFLKVADDQFWLFTVYDKDEADDLSAEQRKALKGRLELEIKIRSTEQ